MKRFWILVVALVILPAVLGACCRTIAPPKPTYYHVSPLAKLRLHGDVDFTPLERGLIDQACRDIVAQTGGWYDVSVTYDLDMSDLEVLQRGHLLIRASEWSMLVQMLDVRRGTHVLGVTVPEKRITWLVSERLDSPTKWRHVAMHELLHQIDLDDLYGPNNQDTIMFHESVAELPTCMRKADSVEFCRVLHCDPERINYCP